MPNNSFHYVRKIRKNNEVFVLNCYTTEESFERIKGIYCNSISCSYEKIGRKNGDIEYQVVLPVDIRQKSTFYISEENSKYRRVWKPSEDFEGSLPDGFYFSNRFLNLTFNCNLEQIKGDRERILQSIEPVLTEIRHSNKHIYLSGYLFTPTQYPDLSNHAVLHIVKFRDEDIQHSFELKILSLNDEERIFGSLKKKEHLKFWQRNILSFSCAIELEKISRFSGYFNLLVEYNNQNGSLKNYHKRLESKDHCYPFSLPFFRKSLFVPYYDDIAKIWKLDIYNISFFEWARLRILYRKYARKNYPKDHNIWLIGEYNDTARDNGLHFFHYMRRKHRKAAVYYVIYGDSSDKKYINDTNVISYGSYEHFRLAAKAKVLIFSHCANYLIPKLNTIVNYRNQCTDFHTIFLQHGIIATTASVLYCRKELRQYDKFVVSSTLEKNNICEHLGYNEKEVIITGLARWDKLLATSKKTTDMLIMPTWRNDLVHVSESVFKRSAFYKFWCALLNNDDFLELIRSNSIKVNFYLHIGFARFAHCFEMPPEIIKANGQNIQELLSTCGLLVTDYSSVAFDVLFQDKPVVFCPFDYDNIMELRKGPQFIDYEKDLPGPACYDMNQAIKEITRIIENNYQMDSLYRMRRNKFFNHIDDGNCERIFNEIKELIFD